MRKFLIKRLLLLGFLLFAVSTMVFFLIHFIPGDPAVIILGESADAEEVLSLRSELNLDKPLIDQYLQFNRNLLNLSFGKSIYNNKEVIRNIMTYLPNTVYLAAVSMFLALLISFPLGAWAAFRENSPIDSLTTFAVSAGVAVPNFFLGPLLIIFFSIKLDLLPVSGSGGFKYVVLPALTLGISMSAYLTRIIRGAVGTELKKPYVLLARAKGLSPVRVFTRHVLKNSLLPVTTTAGLQLGALLTGTIVTETIFSWQGIGILLAQSIHRRDYPMVQGLTLFITFVYLVINFAVDVSYFFIDPRIRNEIKPP
jgi:peptide/nickel transport system permease protein